mgnify:FL=1
MEKVAVTQKRTPWLDRLLMAVAFALTAIFIVTGSYVHDKEVVEVGQVSPKRYVADRDVENVAATERLREEARASVGTLYKQDDSVRDTVVDKVRWFFSDMDDFLLKLEASEAAAAEDEEATPLSYRDAVFSIPVLPTTAQFDAYRALAAAERQRFVADVLDVTEKVLDQGVTGDTLDKSYALAREYAEDLGWDTPLQQLAYSVAEGTLAPNLVLDQEAMDALADQRAAAVKPVMIYKNQKLVDEGEIVTPEIYGILEELNLTNPDYAGNAEPFAASLALTALLYAGAALYFRGSRRKLAGNEVWMLFTAYIITMVIIRAMATLSSFVFLPVTLFAMLISILLDSRRAAVLNAMVCVIGLFIFNGDISFLLYYLITGTLAAFMMPFTEKRNKTVLVCVGMGAVNLICYLAIGVFVQGGLSPELWRESACTILTGALSVLVAVGSLPLWEAAFEANTPTKLLELVNPQNPLLRRLMLEAPGTYHHSLIVANLAETAAYEVGANATLARVGAYYHDIGKLKYPLYFSENQGADNPHDRLEPEQSARILQGHISYGKELAAQQKLPRPVADIVGQHHGTSLIKYFYAQACKKYGAEAVNEMDFRYEGPIPQSREAALVMLADTVEAAVRANVAAGKTGDEIEALIGRLIKDKLDDGQLAQSDLAIKDLETARLAFLRVFQGMYHDRVQYPREEEVKKMQEEGRHHDATVG